jgi:hypothetical protein
MVAEVAIAMGLKMSGTPENVNLFFPAGKVFRHCAAISIVLFLGYGLSSPQFKILPVQSVEVSKCPM